MTNEAQAFLNRLDSFAEGLSAYDQQLLIGLLSDDEGDDVAGFGFEPPWPGVRNILSPIKVTSLTRIDVFLSSGHTTGSNGIAGGDLGSGR